MSKPIHTTTTPETTKTREDAEVSLPPRARLNPLHRGQRFRPHATDSIGVIRSWSNRTVQFHYFHAPDVQHSMERYEFTDRFATWVPRPDSAKPSRAAQRATRLLPARVDATRVVTRTSIIVPAAELGALKQPMCVVAESVRGAA